MVTRSTLDYGEPPPSRSRIPFGSWGAINRAEAQRMALEEYAMPIELRIMWLAMAFSNRIGHATFGVGEVRQLLQSPNRTTGELSPLSDRGFRVALNRAVSQGLIAGHRNQRCLILPEELWAMQAHTSSSCDYCSVGKNAQKLGRIASEVG